MPSDDEYGQTPANVWRIPEDLPVELADPRKRSAPNPPGSASAPQKSLKTLLWHADDHQWGSGHTHKINTQQNTSGQWTTACGKPLKDCPGHPSWAFLSQINCKRCLKT